MHKIWLKSYFWELLSQIWNIFLGVILVNLLYLKNYLEYFRSVWSAKKYFFQIKYWKHLHGLKAAHKKILMFENAFNLRGFGANNFNFSPNV